MKNDMKRFLRRMIRSGGFIAKGVYSESHHFWHSDNRKSVGMMDIVLFNRLRGEGYIKQDRTGKYYPTDKGRKFAMPWYKKIFEVI